VLCLALREEKRARPEWRERLRDIVPDIEDYRQSNDPREVDRFLARPSSTVELWDPSSRNPELDERATHALDMAFALFAFDPALPDDEVRARFDTFLAKVRQDRPITLRRAGPGKPSGAASVSGEHLRRWRAHRILLLFDLMLYGHDPRTERKTLAAWMFPEIKDEMARGNKFDEARRLLDEARSNSRVLWAQARDGM
jgi:hypothetical protein